MKGDYLFPCQTLRQFSTKYWKIVIAKKNGCDTVRHVKVIIMTSATQTDAKPSGANAQRHQTLFRYLGAFFLVILFVPILAIPEKNFLRGTVLPKDPECYPLSHFPMYSNLKNIWTYKLTNEKDEYLSAQREFKGRPNSIRKLFNGRQDQYMEEKNIKTPSRLKPEDWAEIGRRTFTWLLENHEPMGNAANAKAFRLWKEEYKLVDKKLEKKRILIVEFPAPTKAAPAPATVPAPPASTEPTQP